MNRFTNKYILFFSLALMIPVSLTAQKDVRKNIRKGNKAYQQEKYSEAGKFYQSAVEGNAASKEASFNLGNAHYRQKEWDKAIENFNHSISLEQENPLGASAGWHNIGNTILQKKDLQKSMEAYKMALRLNPNDNEARYNLAVVQKMIQDEEQNQGGGEQDQQQDQEKNQDQQQQDQQQEQQPQQNEQDKEKRAEEQNQPEQMSRDNARQLLQAIEQDERETQEKVQQIKAQEREEQAENNKRNNKNW